MAKVMLVDDDADVLATLKDLLAPIHEIISEASNGNEAMMKFNSTLPDILLLDYSMPEKGGLEVLKDIMKINPDAKVVMITANEDQRTIESCVMAGASAYIVKPFDRQTVLNAIAFSLDKEEAPLVTSVY